MTVSNTINHLKHVADKEGITYEEQALAVIAEKADGGMRDALSIFDQAASFCQGNITYQKVIEDLNVLDEDNYFKIIDLALENKVSDIMVTLNGILAKGFDGGNLIGGLANHVRSVMMAKDAQTLPLLECSEEQKAKYQQQAQKASAPFLYKALKIMNDCDIHYRTSSNKRLLVELTLIEVAQITQPADQDVPGAGRTPNRLKSLFKHILTPQPKPVLQGAGAETKPLATHASAPHHAEAETAQPVAASTSSQPTTATSPHLNTNIKLGSIGMTFSNILNGPKKKEYATQDQLTEQEAELDQNSEGGDNQEFTDEELQLQWMMMISRMPRAMIAMSSRMKNMIPKITEFPNVEVVIDNQILLEEIVKIKSRIRATLAATLHNKDIQFNVRLAKEDEVTKILTKKEIFEELRKKNPAIEKLRVQFGLTMA